MMSDKNKINKNSLIILAINSSDVFRNKILIRFFYKHTEMPRFKNL